MKKIVILFLWLFGLVGSMSAELLMVESSGLYLRIHDGQITLVESARDATNNFKVQFVIAHNESESSSLAGFAISLPATDLDVDSTGEYFLTSIDGVLSFNPEIIENKSIWTSVVIPADLCRLSLNGITLIRDGRVMLSRLV